MIPQISLIMGPCAGGAVYSPAITDFVFMVKETSHMFITGPDVIKTVTGEEVELRGARRGDGHATKSGVAHFVADDEDACLEDARYLLRSCRQNNLETAPRVPPSDDPDRMDAELDSIVPDAANKPYDIRDVVRYVVDDGEFLEVHEHYAQNIVVGFSRLNGYAIGVVGNQPKAMAGVLDIDASAKAARFVRFCDAFNIPILTLRRRAGLPPRDLAGVGRDHPPRREAAVRLRRGDRPEDHRDHPQGLRRRLRRHVAPSTCGRTSTSPGRRPRSRSWAPRARSTSSTAATSPQSPTPDERREKLIDDYKARFANPYTAAERGYVDDVIIPHETRPKVIAALEALLTKREPGPQAQARQHPALGRRGRERERQRLASSAGAQRVGGADVLLERDRHRGRWTPGRSTLRLARTRPAAAPGARTRRWSGGRDRSPSAPRRRRWRSTLAVVDAV